MNTRRIVAVLAGGLVLGLGAGWSAWAADEPAAAAPEATAPSMPGGAATSIQDNMDVGLEYTLTVDGKVVDTTDGRTTFHYVQGKQQVIPGLEKRLAGMKVGESKELTISPEEGYGEIDPTAVVEMPKSKLPTDVTPAVGMVLRGVTPDGQGFQARIKELKEDNVVLDLNHPLAGKTLNFKVKVIEIAPVPPQ